MTLHSPSHILTSLHMQMTLHYVEHKQDTMTLKQLNMN